MYGYRIKIDCLPQRVWACETTVSDYQWKNSNTCDMLEISFSKFSSITVTLNGRTHVFHNSSLSCIVGDADREGFCEENAPITIVTVAARLSQWHSSSGEFTSTDFEDDSVLLLPAFLGDLTPSLELDFIKLLHNIIAISTSSEAGRMAFASAFLHLLHSIDELVRSTAADSSQQENFYVRKTEYLLETRFREKITLEEVAKELGISPVYLSTLYKAHTGIPFSSQLLRIRMHQAEKMLLDPNIPTAKVAELCGFCDESYFRKKFRQFFGINVREYRNIKNGLTLYHEKPLRKNQTP